MYIQEFSEYGNDEKEAQIKFLPSSLPCSSSRRILLCLSSWDIFFISSGISTLSSSKAKEMLKHRSGTLYEDMYWIDGDTGEIVASALDEKIEKVFCDFVKFSPE